MPPDKFPTDFTIDHRRIAKNAAIGITDNAIIITVRLEALDAERKERSPLGDKEVLLEITLMNYFVTTDPDGRFIVFDTLHRSS